MNKKGSLILVNIMIAFLVIITAIVIITPMKEVLTLNQDADNLDCDNSSISTGQQMTCIISDVTLPGFFGIAIGIGLAYLGAKKYLFGGSE